MFMSKLQKHSSSAQKSLLAAFIVSALACNTDSYAEKVGSNDSASICGATVDWQDVETYDGSLGPSTLFVDKRQRPVGYMVEIGCSGTLLERDLFLTAGHCVGTSTVGSTVRFNYQKNSAGTGLRAASDYAVTKVEEDQIGGLDYAILRLAGNPSSTFGTSVPSGFDIESGQAITIIQHPARLPKVVEGGTLGYRADGRVSYADLDTEGGSSGSGVLQNSTGLVIGVHTSGTWDDSCGPGDPNKGEAMVDLYVQSPIVRELAIDPAKVVAILG